LPVEKVRKALCEFGTFLSWQDDCSTDFECCVLVKVGSEEVEPVAIGTFNKLYDEGDLERIAVEYLGDHEHAMLFKLKSI